MKASTTVQPSVIERSGIQQHYAQLSDDPLRCAYDGRRPVIPWLARNPVPEPAMLPTWNKLRQNPPRNKTTAYVHIPFCSNRCLFCNFYRNATKPDIARAYVDALIEEIEREAERTVDTDVPVHALYFGGGTPTDLSASDLFRLIKTLRRCLPLAPDCEITVESRAWGCPLEKVQACMDAGANRFSFGVQTFDTQVRQSLGRRMGGEALAEYLAQVCSLDRAAIVCDLIFGLPNQTQESWLRDIAMVNTIQMDGVDLYALTLFPSSPLANAVKKGILPQGADVADQADMYALGAQSLAQLGWRQLTNAHFSRETRERNWYNQLIKSGATCLAYGAGAGGTIGSYSYQVAPDLVRYHRLAAKGEKALVGLYGRGPGYAAKAAVTAGIEVARLDLKQIEGAGVAEFYPTVEPLAKQWEQAGLLKFDDGVIRLTIAGRFWHTNLTTALHQMIDQLLGVPSIPFSNGKMPTQRDISTRELRA